MKKKTQRILSLFMSAVMTVSALSLANFSSYAEVSDSSTEEAVDNSDTELKYGGIFGSLLGDEINDSIQGNEEEQNRDYTVYRITHDPEKAYVGVDYHALTECTLFVGFYDDEGTQLVSSITTDLEEAANGHVDLTVLDVLPDYYLIKAFIVGKQFREPLSKPAVYNKQTKKMQEILEKSTEDFEEDTVVNLDDQKDNNFVILQEGVIDITPTETTDIYKEEDENGNYIFENADKIAELKKGDKVFVRSSPDMLAFIVDDIEKDGDTVIIKHSDFDIGEIIAFIKFDAKEYTGESNLDNYEIKDENVTYIKKQSQPSPKRLAPKSQSDDPYMLEYPTIKAEMDNIKVSNVRTDWKLDFKEKEITSSTKIYGSMLLGVTFDLEIYYEFGVFENFFSVEGKVTFSAEVSIITQFKKEFPFTIPLFSIGVLSICFEPKLVIDVKGKVSFSYERTYYLYANSLDLSITHCDPLITKFDASVTIDFEIVGSLTLRLAFYKALSFDPYIGLRFKAHGTDPIYESPTDNYIRHDCENPCFSLDVSIIYGITINLNIPWCKVTRGLARCEYPYGTFYFNKDDHGFGKCPNYSHKMIVKITDEKGNPISNVKLYRECFNIPKGLLINRDDNEPLLSDKDGLIEFFEKDRNLDHYYFLTAVTPDNETARVVKDEDWTFKEDRAQVIKIKIQTRKKTGGEKDEEYDNNSEYVEDANPIFWLGDDVFMQVFPETETAYIYGNGLLDCERYSKQVNPQYKNKIKKLIFLGDGVKLSNNDYHVYFNSFADEGEPYGNIEYIDISSLNIEKLPNYLFNNCQKLKEVKLPDTIKTIEEGAFWCCFDLEKINLPSNLETIEYQAFYRTGLKRIDCPDKLKSIEEQAFYISENLTEINLNYGLQFIGDCAFQETNIKSINIPGTVKNLGKYILYKDDSLKTVIINGDYDSTEYDTDSSGNIVPRKAYDEFMGSNGIEKVIFNDGVTRVSKSAFVGCKNLKEVRFSKTITEIAPHAFRLTGLTSVVIPENIKSIGASAFITDTLKDITILNKDCEIPSDDTIATYGPQLTIHGYRGSTAEDYAKRMNNTFIPLDPVEEVTTTTAQTTTTTTTTVTAVASTVVAPDSECVFMIVNEDKAVPDEADKLLDESNLYYFDQQTADENGNVKFGYVPDNTVDRLFIFISEVVNGSIKEISRSVGKPGDMKTTVYTQPVPTKEENIVFGDTNGDGEIDMSDAVLIMQSISNPNKYGMNGTAAVHMTEAGKKNADVYDPGSGVTSMDALTIQRYLMGIHTTLPVYKNS